MSAKEITLGLNHHEASVFTGNVDDVVLMPFGQDGGIFIASTRANLPVSYTSNLTANFASSNEPINQSRHEIFTAVQQAIAGISPETAEDALLSTLGEICDQTLKGFDARRQDIYFNTAFGQFEENMVLGIISHGQLFLLARKEWGSGDSTTYHMTAGVIRGGKLTTLDNGIPLDQAHGNYKGAKITLLQGDLVCSANSFACSEPYLRDTEIKGVTSAVANMQKTYRSIMRDDIETPSILCVEVTDVSVNNSSTA